ncbi:heme utilization protein [Pseudomonas costantinii]|uniref:Heme utilization protein n=1 Tax=Pseudomonas costantinii TaxID=168469 RepID=A0A1S2V0V4_9PSED|nr:heme utilization protein [Pseudomonas costantinii]NVZ23313.1 heme utilization protein [Pseudomonas costantinii]OIN52035.1 heme utilization protein [Pseudomonas costantinii]SEE48580.1 hypothetical protein SAMN04515675_5820 [Pseudomonas costantinii]
MKPTMALKPLAFALAALMAVAVQADPRHHHHTAPTTLAVSVADSQNNSGNVTLNDKTLNNASTTNSLNSNSGISGGNVLSGTGNAGKNDVAIGSADDAAQVFAAVGVSQNNSGNLVTNSGNTNNASETNSSNSNSGVSQATVAAGTGNAGSNSVAIAAGDGKSGGASITAIQNVSGNLTLNATASGHGWGWGSSKIVTNNASLTNSGNSNVGVSGINNLSGTGNLGANNVSITKF